MTSTPVIAKEHQATLKQLGKRWKKILPILAKAADSGSDNANTKGNGTSMAKAAPEARPKKPKNKAAAKSSK